MDNADCLKMMRMAKKRQNANYWAAVESGNSK